MSGHLKLWTGIGLYILVSGAACGETRRDPPIGSAGGDPPVLSMASTNPECRPIPAEGGGEGGEEGGGSLGSGSTRPAVVLAPEQQFQDRQILVDFADQVVIPAYEQLAADTQALSQAIQAFVKDPNPRTLEAARQAWSVARITWEESEAFAFGPAASLGLDANLDEWPLNEVEVLEVLKSGDPLAPEIVADLESGQKGFHAVAFLLFGVDNNKSLEDFTERDREYLAAVSSVLADTAKNCSKAGQRGWKDYLPFAKDG